MLRYFRVTTQFGLCYVKIEEVKLQGFIDAYFVVSPSDKNSVLGGIFSIEAIVSWYNRKQIPISLSSTNKKYMAPNQAACESI